MESRKRFYKIVMVISSIIFAQILTQKIQVQAAASYQTITTNPYIAKKDRRVGNAIFLYDWGKIYIIENGKKELLLSNRPDTQIVTNGKFAYYCTHGYGITKVCRISILEKNDEEQFSLNKHSVELVGYCNGRIYYTLYGSVLWSYDIKTGTPERIEYGVTGVKQHKKYLCMVKRGRSLCVYDTKKKTLKTICKNHNLTGGQQGRFDIISDYIYYTDYLRQTPGGGSIQGGVYLWTTVRKCKLDGTNRRTLAERLPIVMGSSITFKKDSVTYLSGFTGKRKRTKFK